MREFVIQAMATFYLSWVFVDESGPFGMFAKLRREFGVFRCVVCLAFWMGIVCTVINVDVLLPFALAGIATAIRFPVLNYKRCAAMMSDAETIKKND